MPSSTESSSWSRPSTPWRSTSVWRSIRRLQAAFCGLVLAVLLQPMVAGAQTVTPRDAIRLADLGYNDDVLRGRLFSADYFVPGPGEYPLSSAGSILELVFAATDLAGPNSVLTVSWNGLPLRDLALPATSAPQALSVPLPIDKIDPALNRLTISGQLDMQTSACRDDNPANHVTVFKATAVRYPAPFFDAAPVAPSNVLLVLPGNPSDDVLSAAAAVSASLGRAAGSHPLS